MSKPTLLSKYPLIACFVVLLFVLVYFHIIATPYFHLDDALLFSNNYLSAREDFFRSPGLVSSVRGGRLFNGLGLWFFASWLDRANNMDLVFITMRCFSLVSVSVSCALIALWILRQGASTWVATALPLSIFFLPGYQVAIGDSSPGVSTYGLILAAGAIFAIGTKHFHVYKISQLTQKSVCIRAFSVVFLLQLSFHSYQLYPLIFLFAPAYILMLTDMDIRKRVFTSLFLIVLFIVALAIYYVTYKYIILEWAVTYNAYIKQIPGREANYPLTISHLASNIGYLISM